MLSGQKQEIRVHIRWMINRDMEEVVAIERECFEFPWLNEDFLITLRQRNCIGMACEYQDEIVGFMIYDFGKYRILLLNFAVAMAWRKMGVGSQMVAKLITKLSFKKRRSIILEVRETNLPAQLFFRKNGFEATGVLRNHYEDTNEDAYLMRYRFKPQETTSQGLSENLVTRLSG